MEVDWLHFLHFFLKEKVCDWLKLKAGRGRRDWFGLVGLAGSGRKVNWREVRGKKNTRSTI